MLNKIYSTLFTVLSPLHLTGPELFIRLMKSHHRTYVDLPRLRHLASCCARLRDTRGAFVECGVGKGGCVALMSFISKGYNPVWAFDSFEGMPPLTAEDEGSGEEWVGHRCAGEDGVADVQHTLRLGRLDDASVHIVKGYFEDTLASSRDAIGPIAVLRLDNDWYKSTKFCLDTLYDQVISGGVILIDDYGVFKGCRKAVDEFRTSRRITSALTRTEGQDQEYYWIKE